MKRDSMHTVAGCLVLMFVLASTGCERDSRPDYGWVTVQNYSSQTVGYLYVSPSSSSSWGTDQLGSTTISPGNSFTLYHLEVGYYDLLIEDLGHNLLTDGYGVYIGTGGVTWTMTD
jgi:hypothetical protein